MSQIVLINPPIQDFYRTKIRSEPLGLESLAAVLGRDGHQVQIIDALDSPASKKISLPSRLDYLKDYYPPEDLSPFKLFTRYRHYGMPFEEIQRRLASMKPDIIGISANFTPYFDVALKVARMCKKTLPDVPVVLGGHHVSADPDSALQSPDVDYVVLGEGEYTFLKLVRHLEMNEIPSLPGIACKSGINPISEFIEDLDALPYPRAAFTKNKMILTSRGCPRECNFCSIRTVMGSRVRYRSIASIIDEIRQAVRHGARYIDFEDDNLTLNRKRAVELFGALRANFKSQKLMFSAMNGLDAQTLDEEMIASMKEAGFEWLNLPLVSGNSQIQQEVARGQSREQFAEVLHHARKYDLKVVAYLILGLPEDQLDGMIRDIAFLGGQHALIGPSIFYPPPGSLTYMNCVSRGYIQAGEYAPLRSTAIPVETENFKRPDIVTLLRMCRAINYVKQIIDECLTSDSNISVFLTEKLSTVRRNVKLSVDEIGWILLHDVFINAKLAGLKRISAHRYASLPYLHSASLVRVLLSELKKNPLRGINSCYHFIMDLKNL